LDPQQIERGLVLESLQNQFNLVVLWIVMFERTGNLVSLVQTHQLPLHENHDMLLWSFGEDFIKYMSYYIIIAQSS
jgi:hypothetical protein